MKRVNLEISLEQDDKRLVVNLRIAEDVEGDDFIFICIQPTDPDENPLFEEDLELDMFRHGNSQRENLENDLLKHLSDPDTQEVLVAVNDLISLWNNPPN